MVFRDQQKFIVLAMRLLDLVVVVVSFTLAIRLRSLINLPSLEPFTLTYSTYWDIFLLVLIVWWVLLSWNKTYASHRGHSRWQISWIVIKVNVLGLLSLGTILFFLQEYEVHRTLIMLFVVICTGSLLLEKHVLFSILHYLRKRGLFIKYALIVGTDSDARQLLSQLHLRGAAGLKVVGFVTDRSLQEPSSIDGVPILGSLEDMRCLLENHVVDEVFITVSLHDLTRIDTVLNDCQEIGVNARLLVHSLAPQNTRMFVDEFLDVPFISFSTTPMSALALNTKLVLDCISALILLIVLAPLLLVIGLLIKLDSPGQVFFKQQRAGRNGRRFFMYKFRSMVDGAEQRRAEVENLNTMSGPIFKARSDPRTTRLGSLLRRTSLDELPQLFNVFIGEMSLVGPRPLPIYEAEQINGSARRRLSMKPGITGLWQVSGRSNLDFSDWIRLDLEYIDQWSLLLDCRILLKTFPALIKSRGAY